jgi:hypothetical protein
LGIARCHLPRPLFLISPQSCARIRLCASLVPASPSSNLGVVLCARSNSLWQLTQRITFGEASSLALGIGFPQSMHMREGGSGSGNCVGVGTGLELGCDGGEMVGGTGVEATLVAVGVTAASLGSSTCHMSPDLVIVTDRPSSTANFLAKAEASGKDLNVRVAIKTPNCYLDDICPITPASAMLSVICPITWHSQLIGHLSDNTATASLLVTWGRFQLIGQPRPSLCMMCLHFYH